MSQDLRCHLPVHSRKAGQFRRSGPAEDFKGIKLFEENPFSLPAHAGDFVEDGTNDFLFFQAPVVGNRKTVGFISYLLKEVKRRGIPWNGNPASLPPGINGFEALRKRNATRWRISTDLCRKSTCLPPIGCLS